MQNKPQDKLLTVKIFLLVLASGLINAYCVSNFKVPVAHHTGNATEMALAIGNRQQYVTYLAILALFFFGSLCSSFLTYGGRIQPGLLAMFILCLITYILKDCPVYLLVFIFGFQNSLPLHYEGALVRSTHITGYLTDSAVIIGRFLRHKDGSHLPLAGFISCPLPCLSSAAFLIFISSTIASLPLPCCTWY